MMLYPTGNMENRQCIKFSTVGDFSDNLIILANCLSGNYLILHQIFILFANVGYFF